MVISKNRYETISKLQLINGEYSISHTSCGEYLNGLYKIRYHDLEEIENRCVYDISVLKKVKHENIEIGLIKKIYEHYKKIFLKYNISNYEIEIVEEEGFKAFQNERETLIEPIKRYSINFSVYSLVNTLNYERGFGGTIIDKILDLDNQVEELIKVSLTKSSYVKIDGYFPMSLS